MKATLFEGKESVKIGDRPDPKIIDKTDAIVRVVMGCVCGSDLWYYRGQVDHAHGSIGHEFIGVIDKIGESVKDLREGDFVIAPFKYSDGTCANCLAGDTANCINGGGFGNGESDGGQGEFVRVPYADGTLVKVPGTDFSEDTLASLLSLSDVMCTGYHAAVSAGVKKGDIVAVVGDGAVGLCAVIASKMLGAKRIIALSRNPARQKLAKKFGATDIVEERGEDAVTKLLELTNGVGVDMSLECVGTDDAIATAIGGTRAGGMIGTVGLPMYNDFSYRQLFFKNLGIKGGVAHARAYIPELMGKVLDGSINPGLVFDLRTDLDNIAEAYTAMDERRAVKSLLKISDIS